MYFEERACRLCGKPILDIFMEDGTKYPVDYPPVDIEPQDRNKTKPLELFILPAGRKIMACRGETNHRTVLAYIPHAKTCEKFIKEGERTR